MAEIVNMPKLGFDMAEGTLVRWVKHEQESIAKGEILAEIETDKATVEVESYHTGVVYKHLVEEGTILAVGIPIAVIAEKDEKVDLEALLGAQDEKKRNETEIRKESAGTPDVSAEEASPSLDQNESGGRIKASPLAKRVAADNNLDLKNIQGSGPEGRIVRKDVEAFIAAGTKPEKIAAAAIEVPQKETVPTGKPQLPVIPLVGWEVAGSRKADEKITVNRLRAAIGRRLVESKQQVPHFYITRDVDMEKVLNLRKEINENVPAENKLSVNDFIVKAVALALRKYPNLNASLSGLELTRHGQVNIGVAVAVEGGLLTVVVKDADQKPLRVISQEVKEMAARVRTGKVKTEDIEGSTFSISNLGMYDVESFVAIINPPEAAILAVGTAREVPVVKNGELKVGQMMKITLSADHRITDGAEAAQFMQAVAYELENSIRLML